MKDPIILDTTLRDGEQTPGVVFNLDEKLEIAGLLEMSGITDVETGTPAMGENETDDMRILHSHGFAFRSLAWCRACKKDILLAAKTNTQGIHVSFPVSTIHLNAMGRSGKWVLEQMRELIPIASGLADFVTVGFQDASRAEISFLEEILSLLDEYPVERVRIADTAGILNPFGVFELFQHLNVQFPAQKFEFHGHNDLGMATANSLAAFRAGAVCINTTLNGLGERAGNAAFEEFVMALKYSCNHDLKVNTTLFSKMSQYVAHASGIPVPVNKPVTGPSVFKHESGIHTHLLLKNRKTYQAVSAGDMGRQEDEFVFGKHSGIHALKDLLSRLKIQLPEKQQYKLVFELKNEAIRKKRSLSAEELLHLIHDSSREKTKSDAILFE